METTLLFEYTTPHTTISNGDDEDVVSENLIHDVDQPHITEKGNSRY